MDKDEARAWFEDIVDILEMHSPDKATAFDDAWYLIVQGANEERWRDYIGRAVVKSSSATVPGTYFKAILRSAVDVDLSRPPDKKTAAPYHGYYSGEFHIDAAPEPFPPLSEGAAICRQARRAAPWDTPEEELRQIGIDAARQFCEEWRARRSEE